MTEIKIERDLEAGTANLILVGHDATDGKIRLRDAETGKYLTRRGWGKAPAFLPAERTSIDDGVAYALSEDLVRRIPDGAQLVVEDPANDLEEKVSWPGTDASPTAAPVVVPVAGLAPGVPVASSGGDVSSGDASSTADEPSATRPEPEMPETLEPPMFGEPVSHRTADEKPEPSPADEPDEPASRNWKPLAIAATLFFILGMGFTWALMSGAQSARVERELANARQAWDAEKQELSAKVAAAEADAEEAAAVSADKASSEITALNQSLEKMTSERDALTKARQEGQGEVERLQGLIKQSGDELRTRLDKAETTAAQTIAGLNKEIDQLKKAAEASESELTTVRDARKTAEQALEGLRADLAKAKDDLKTAATDAEARIAAANQSAAEKVKAQTAELEKARKAIADRDALLRDNQAKLSVADVQIDTLKTLAEKSSKADLDRKAALDRTRQLTSDLEKARSDLESRQSDLAAAKSQLAEAKAELAEVQDQLKNQSVAQNSSANQQDNGTQAADAARFKDLQEERDLYADELKRMTDKFAALLEEKNALAKAQGVSEPQDTANVAATDADTSTDEDEVASAPPIADTPIPEPAPATGVWGATAIDRLGKIYAVQNKASESQARSDALASCRDSSGNCEPLTTYSNACFSLARFTGERPANDNFGYVVNKDRRKAEAAALAQCRSLGFACTTRLTSCSPDARAEAAND